MEERFSVQISNIVIIVFFIAVALVAGATAWSFRSGFMWTGICLIAVAAPIAIFFWYMLYVNPQRAQITLTEDAMLITAPPFLEATVPYKSMSRAFMADIKSDSRLASKEDKRIMRFFGYICGSYIMESGGEAIILTNKKEVVCLESDGLYILLGPDGMKRFKETMADRGIKIAGA